MPIIPPPAGEPGHPRWTKLGAVPVTRLQPAMPDGLGCARNRPLRQFAPTPDGATHAAVKSAAYDPRIRHGACRPRRQEYRHHRIVTARTAIHQRRSSRTVSAAVRVPTPADPVRTATRHADCFSCSPRPHPGRGRRRSEVSGTVGEFFRVPPSPRLARLRPVSLLRPHAPAAFTRLPHSLARRHPRSLCASRECRAPAPSPRSPRPTLAIFPVLTE